MENIAWMAWTPPTAIFFVFAGDDVGGDDVACRLPIRRPRRVRGPANFRPRAGDRLFISLIMAAVIHLLWVGFVGTDTIATLPVGEGIELSSLWLANRDFRLPLPSQYSARSRRTKKSRSGGKPGPESLSL